MRQGLYPFAGSFCSVAVERLLKILDYKLITLLGDIPNTVNVVTQVK